MRLIFFSVMCSDLVISAQRIEGPESFIIEIEKSKVNGLLQEFEGDMSYLAQFLRLQDKRMVLINPVSLNSLLSSLMFVSIEILRCWGEA